jgi:serine/threonine-protein kinase HipA
VTRWEAVALTLAAHGGIPTPEWRMENVGDRAVVLLRRFDRANGQRVPFLSATSLLDAEDNEQRSYLEIADALRRYGARPDEDCAQLWRRIVLNILIANTDDHLRDHGFLYDPAGGWRLAPAYDLNPVPMDIKPRVLATAIDESDGTGVLELALEGRGAFRDPSRQGANHCLRGRRRCEAVAGRCAVPRPVGKGNRSHGFGVHGR